MFFVRLSMTPLGKIVSPVVVLPYRVVGSPGLDTGK